MIGAITILMDDNKKSEVINELLHSYADNILGRMGLPHIEEKFILTFVFKGKEEKYEELVEKIKKVEGVKVGNLKI